MLHTDTYYYYEHRANEAMTLFENACIGFCDGLHGNHRSYKLVLYYAMYRDAYLYWRLKKLWGEIEYCLERMSEDC